MQEPEPDQVSVHNVLLRDEYLFPPHVDSPVAKDVAEPGAVQRPRSRVHPSPFKSSSPYHDNDHPKCYSGGGFPPFLFEESLQKTVNPSDLFCFDELRLVNKDSQHTPVSIFGIHEEDYRFVPQADHNLFESPEPPEADDDDDDDVYEQQQASPRPACLRTSGQSLSGPQSPRPSNVRPSPQPSSSSVRPSSVRPSPQPSSSNVRPSGVRAADIYSSAEQETCDLEGKPERKEPSRTRKPGSIASGPTSCVKINPSTGKPCHKVFSRPYDLNRHNDTVHCRSKRILFCEFCGELSRAFSRQDALTRHMRSKHPLTN